MRTATLEEKVIGKAEELKAKADEIREKTEGFKDKAEDIKDKAEEFRDKATRLKESIFRPRLENGDIVRIYWILDNPNFECKIAREKMEEWVEERKQIIEYGIRTSQKPDNQEEPAGKERKKKGRRKKGGEIEKAKKESKWIPVKFSFRGKVMGSIGKNLFKVEILTDKGYRVGAFSGKELIFIERPPLQYQR